MEPSRFLPGRSFHDFLTFGPFFVAASPRIRVALSCLLLSHRCSSISGPNGVIWWQDKFSYKKNVPEMCLRDFLRSASKTDPFMGF